LFYFKYGRIRIMAGNKERVNRAQDRALERLNYGRPRSKSFHWKYYKKLLEENGLPDMRGHDLRSTFCTIIAGSSA
jgi:hypothetical protein